MIKGVMRKSHSSFSGLNLKRRSLQAEILTNTPLTLTDNHMNSAT